MRKYIFIFALFMLSESISAREIFNINRNWRFFGQNEKTGENSHFVNLPHTWNADTPTDARGIGNYLKTMDIPANWCDKRVFIRLYGTSAITTMMVNGQLAGEHRGGYTAFTFEITKLLRYGEKNYLRAMVNNSLQTDVMPTAGDANMYGGIFRDVELIVTPQATISLTDNSSDGVYIVQKEVSKSKVTAEAVIKICSSIEKNMHASITLTDAKSNKILQLSSKIKPENNKTTTLTIPFTIENPKLWNGTKNPHLYSITVKLYDDNTMYDSLTIKTGFRYFNVDPNKGFVLNGEPYAIKGVFARQDRASVGPALVPYQIEEDIDMMIDMGVNMVRVEGFLHSPLFYDLCDKAGILVYSELPFMAGEIYSPDIAFFNTDRFKTNGQQQLSDIIRQQFNHPSIVMWGLFSCLTQRGDSPVEYIKTLNSTAKSEDPSRLTVATSNTDGEVNFITDLVIWKHHFGWIEGNPSDIQVWQQQLHTNWTSLRSAVAYGAGASIRHQAQDSLQRPNYRGNWHPENWQTYLHESYYDYLKTDSLFWGIFVSNMFEYGAAELTSGDGSGVNDMGLVTFDRKYRKDAFYFYKANWNQSNPFVYIAERRNNVRDKITQTIKIFSNNKQVELLVNGVSIGSLDGYNGTFVWHNINLSKGENIIEARTADAHDNVVITINAR